MKLIIAIIFSLLCLSCIITKEYFETEDEKVYFFEPLEKEISVEEMQKIVDTNEKLVKDMKNGSK